MRKIKDQKKPQEESYGYIRHVREVPDEKECPECNGTGYDPWDGGQCERCAGTGMVPRENSYY